MRRVHDALVRLVPEPVPAGEPEVDGLDRGRLARVGHPDLTIGISVLQWK